MTLTPQQLTSLRGDLTKFVRLDYAHLRDELLDHYATLTENKMAAGLSFQEASDNAWLDMGDSEGIQKIQTTYEIITRKQLSRRHYAILTGFLRWPIIAPTLLTAALTTLLLLALPPSLSYTLTIALIYSPLLVMAVTALSILYKKDSRKKLALRYVIQRGLVPVVLLTWLDVAGFQEPSRANLFVLMPLAGISLYLAVSLTQLIRKPFSVKLT